MNENRIIANNGSSIVLYTTDDGSTIELRGFGTFELRLRKERKKARNPKTGDSLSVPPHYIVAFRSGQELKRAVWDLKIEE